MKKSRIFSFLGLMFIFFLASCRVNGNKSPDKTDELDKTESKTKDDDKKDDIKNETFLISFYKDDSIYFKVSYQKGEKIEIPVNPIKDNYVFIGWFTDNLFNHQYDFNNLVRDNLNLYAKFIPISVSEKKYPVQFINDGSLFYSSLEKENLNVQKPPYTPFKDGYEFLGWYLDLYDDEAYDFSKPLTSSLRLYAKYDMLDEVNIVSFYDNNSVIDSFTIINNSKISKNINNPFKSGFKFIGWFMDKNFQTPFNINNTISSNLKIYAKFEEKNSYSVSYHVDGLLYHTSIVYEDELIDIIENPVKPGYQFTGWFLNVNDNNQYDFNTKINSSLDLNAKFIKNEIDKPVLKHIINFYIDGELFDSIKVEENKLLIAPSKLVLNYGYKLLGWYYSLSDEEPYDFNMPVINNFDLHAKFDVDDEAYEEYLNKSQSLTKVGVSYEILGTVERHLPIVSSGGLSSYPIYNGQPITDEVLGKAVYDENKTLIPSSTTYDAIDNEGNLLLNGVRTGNKLYKHTASIGMYGNSALTDRSLSDVSDSEKAVIKKISVYDNKPLVNYLTGLYAPAGEVVKVEISNESLEAAGGSFYIFIGLTTSRTAGSDLVNVPYNRMPLIQSKFEIKNNVSYVGSFLGGPIYIIPKIQCNFEAVISGAVEYLHYIDGVTNEAEFNRLLNTTAPYFDSETYDRGVRFSGPRYSIYPTSADSNITPLTYDNIVKVTKMWEQFSITSNKFPKGNDPRSDITMYFDTYIRMAGASAVAIVGRDYSNLPLSWMRLSLDYNSFMTSGGWGPIHEFNHHYQKFGANDNNNEVTNNVVNYIEYILFTRITEYRDYLNLSHGYGLDSHYGIEYYNKYLNTTTALNTENGYGMLLQNIGPLAMIEVAKMQGQSSTFATNADEFYKALTKTLKMDFTYLIESVWHLSLSQSVVSEMKAYGYPMYIPIGSYYSSSFKYVDNLGNTMLESKHALPFIVPSDFTFDLVNDINTLSGYNVIINRISSPEHGTLTRLNNGLYRYCSSDKQIDSFDVEVTIVGPSYNQKVIISYDLNPIATGIEKIVYKFDTKIYSKIEDAIDANFKGASLITRNYMHEVNGVSGVQSGQIVEVLGKFEITETADYNVTYMGGRGSSVMYGSVNNTDNYVKIGNITINQSGYMFGGTATSHLKMSLNKGDVLYYKLYLLATSNNASLKIGLSKTDNVRDVVDVPNELFKGQYTYLNEITPVNYELRNIVQREYYKDIFDVDTSLFEVTSPNFVPWNNSYTLDKIFDDDDSTYAHSQSGVTISENAPIDLIIDAKKQYLFNIMVLYGANSNKSQLPITFDFYISDDGQNYNLVKNYINLPVTTNSSIKLSFEKPIVTRFIKFHITETNPQYLALSNIKFGYDAKAIRLEEARYFGEITETPSNNMWGHSYTLNSASSMKLDFKGETILLDLNFDAIKYKFLLDDKEIAFDKDNIDISGYYKLKCPLNKNHKLKIIVETGLIEVREIYVN